WILKLGKRRFGRSQKTLKDLERNAAREMKALKRALTKKLPNGSEMPVNPLLVFIADEATLNLDGAPIAAVHRKKLKSYLRRLERQKSYSAEEIQQLVSAFNIAPDDSD
ncbi:MAG: hypothetical protein KAS80_02480, partial [Anaerolineales bacterium]|nr:hypothetical protein [Anaerolineales bacterium]